MNAPRHSAKMFMLQRSLARVQSSKQSTIPGTSRKLQLSHGPENYIKERMWLLCEGIPTFAQLCTAERHNY